MNSCKLNDLGDSKTTHLSPLSLTLFVCVCVHSHTRTHSRTNQEEMLDSIHDKSSQFEDSGSLSSEIQTTVSHYHYYISLPCYHITLPWNIILAFRLKWAHPNSWHSFGLVSHLC